MHLATGLDALVILGVVVYVFLQEVYHDSDSDDAGRRGCLRVVARGPLLLLVVALSVQRILPSSGKIY